MARRPLIAIPGSPKSTRVDKFGPEVNPALLAPGFVDGQQGECDRCDDFTELEQLLPRPNRPNIVTPLMHRKGEPHSHYYRLCEACTEFASYHWMKDGNPSEWLFMSVDFKAIKVARLLHALGVKGKRFGTAWNCSCPFHHETSRTPGWFMVDDFGGKKNGIHHCFSCGAKGNAVDLTMHILGVGYGGALSFIEENALGKAPVSLAVQLQIASPFKDDFKLPRSVQVGPLESWPWAPRKYLVESRKVTAEQVERWQMGYCLDGRLAGRIVVPVYDNKNVLRSYTARAYIDNPSRYLEPLASEGASEGVIFGESDWPAPADRKMVVVTEGAFNGLAVERVFPTLPFGSLQGSHLLPMQVLKLSTFKRVIVFTDDDPAGNKAADEIIAAIGRHVPYSRVKLPVGKDPNSVDPVALEEVLLPCVSKMLEAQSVSF